jgi:hypothetical protein
VALGVAVARAPREVQSGASRWSGRPRGRIGLGRKAPGERQSGLPALVGIVRYEDGTVDIRIDADKDGAPEAVRTVPLGPETARRLEHWGSPPC